MEWLKKNIIVVVFGVVSLLLLAGSGYFLFSQINADKEATAKLAQTRQRWESLERKKPHPGSESVDNINAAKRDANNVSSFLNSVEKRFSSSEYPVVTNSFDFKTLLETTVAELRKDAKQAGVEIPDGYSFTFRGQMAKIQFADEEIQVLANQLTDIKEISNLVYGQRVHSLESLRRVASGTDDRIAKDFMKGAITTNEVAVVSPYEVVVKGFSRELEGMLAGLANADGCYRLRSVAVEHTELNASSAVSAVPFGGQFRRANPYATGEPTAQTRSDRFASAYGGERRSAVVAGGEQSRPAPIRYAQAAPVSVGSEELNERPLKITLYFDAIRPIQTAQ